MKKIFVAFALASVMSAPLMAQDLSTAVPVKASLFMDVKEVVSDTPDVAHDAVFIAEKSCGNESRTMYFKDSEDVLKVVKYVSAKPNGCGDGDGGFIWGKS